MAVHVAARLDEGNRRQRAGADVRIEVARMLEARARCGLARSRAAIGVPVAAGGLGRFDWIHRGGRRRRRGRSRGQGLEGKGIRGQLKCGSEATLISLSCCACRQRRAILPVVPERERERQLS